MARPGPKPKPTKIKLLHGNPGQRRLNENEPNIPGDLRNAPDWFTPEQRAAWDYALLHAPPGMLRPLDRSALVAWVVAEDLHRQACVMQQHLGLLTRVGRPPEAGEPDTRPLQQSPFLPIINKQASIMLKAAAELGFTPSSRTRVSVPPDGPILPGRIIEQDEKPSALEDFLANPPPVPSMH